MVGVMHAIVWLLPLALSRASNVATRAKQPVDSFLASVEAAPVPRDSLKLHSRRIRVRSFKTERAERISRRRHSHQPDTNGEVVAGIALDFSLDGPEGDGLSWRRPAAGQFRPRHVLLSDSVNEDINETERIGRARHARYHGWLDGNDSRYSRTRPQRRYSYRHGRTIARIRGRRRGGRQYWLSSTEEDSLEESYGDDEEDESYRSSPRRNRRRQGLRRGRGRRLRTRHTRNRRRHLTRTRDRRRRYRSERSPRRTRSDMSLTQDSTNEREDSTGEIVAAVNQRGRRVTLTVASTTRVRRRDALTATQSAPTVAPEVVIPIGTEFMTQGYPSVVFVTQFITQTETKTTTLQVVPTPITEEDQTPDLPEIPDDEIVEFR